MGKLKSHYHDEICERANDEPWGQEPNDLEMLAADAELAQQRFEEALMRKDHERSR